MRPKRVILTIVLGSLMLMLGGIPVLAQPSPGAPSPDPIAQNLFPPDLIFSQADAIGLTDAQKASIQSVVLNAQSHFVLLQPRLARAMQAMVSVISPSRVNEAQVMARLENVLSAEREIKRTQVGLMIRIKNLLTVEQQAKLRQLRTDAAPH